MAHSATSPLSARSPAGLGERPTLALVPEALPFNGAMEEVRVRLRRDMIRHLALMLLDGPREYRDRGHLVRTLLAEALHARAIRMACPHFWAGGRCQTCGRTALEATAASGVELVLRFANPSDVALFKSDAPARHRLLERADWTQGSFVPVALAA